ncbi:hypothetical protein [Nonlabens antarcticus]|uniref:hypothetical protein n=1 Tax=Nonlabens antarcticus TaxID=392714 RepID=UPI0018910594|nr:hypothetical protein [Nonlabens antarcticus]
MKSFSKIICLFIALVFTSSISYASVYELVHEIQKPVSKEKSGNTDHVKQFKLGTELSVSEASLHILPELLPLSPSQNLIGSGNYGYSSSHYCDARNGRSAFWLNAVYHKNFIREILFPFHSFW